MTDLTGKLISGTYQQLLLINSSTANEGVSTSATYVQTGDGTNTALKVATNKVIVETALRVDGTATITSGLHVSGKVCASSFFGDGSNLTGLTASIGGDISVSSITVAAGVNIGGSLKVVDNVSVSGNIHAVGAVSVGGTLTQTGVATFVSNVTVGGKLVVEGDVSVSGQLDVNENVSVGGTLLVTGTGTLTGKTEFKNDVSVSGRLDVAGSVSVGSVLNVTGIGNFATDVSVSGNMHVVGNVTAALYYGDGSNLTNVVASLGNLPESVSISGYLNVGGAVSITGAATFSSTVTVVGNAVLASLDVTGVATAATFEPDGDTAAGDNAAIGYTAAEGLILTGQGSTSDITLKNDADAVVFTVPTGSASISFPDLAHINFGDSGDLQIYHAASSSYIDDAGTGPLNIRSSTINLSKYTGETMATFVADGAVTLYHDNASKFATTATGVDVTGTIVGDGLTLTTGATVTTVLDEDNMASNSATALSTQQSIKAYVDAQVDTTDTLAEVLAIGNTTGGTDLGVSAGDDVTFTDSSKAIFGAGSDLKIFHEGSNSYIQDVGTGGLLVEGSSVTIRNSDGTEAMASFTPDGAVSLYHNNAIKLATAATGVTMTGEVTATGFTGTLDGVLGGGTPAAATVTTLNASGTITGPANTTLANAGGGGSYVELVANSQKQFDAYTVGGTTANWVRATGSQAGSPIILSAEGSDTNIGITLTPKGSGDLNINGNVLVSNAAGPSILDEAATSTNPTLVPNRADLDTGVGWVSADIGSLVAGGASVAHFKSGSLEMAATYGPALVNAAPSSTAPSVLVGKTDTNTGLGSPTGDQLSLIAGGVEALRVYATYLDLNVTLQAANAAGPSLLNEAASATNPTLIPNRAAPTVGIGAASATTLSLIAASTEVVRINSTTMFFKGSGGIECDNAAGAKISNVAPTATVPTLIPNKTDANTGVGWVSADIGSLVAGGASTAHFKSGSLEMAATQGPALMNENASNTNPTLVPRKTDTGTGWGSNGTNNLEGIVASVRTVLFGASLTSFHNTGGSEVARIDRSTGNFQMINAAGPSLLQEAATATNPTIIPNKADPDTGVGWVSADIGSLVAGGVKALQWQSSGVVSVPAALSFTDNNGPSWGSTWQTGNASSQFISFYINSVLAGQVNATGVTVGNAAGGSILNEGATATNPTIIPNKADPNTGIGWVSADVGALVAGGTNALSFSNSILAANVSFRFRSVTVSGLPGSATAGDTRYASDGRKAGEGSGSGTGVLAFYDGSNWIAVDTGATVAA